MPVIMGVLIDIINSSNNNTFIRGSIIELVLPSILKILMLIIEKKIKSK